LLEALGSPAAMAKAGLPQVTEFLRKAARRTPEPEMVRGLMHAARTTSGAALVADELQLVRMMASEILRLFEMREQVDSRIEKLGADVPAVRAMRPCLGAVTAAVVFAYLGAPPTKAALLRSKRPRGSTSSREAAETIRAPNTSAAYPDRAARTAFCENRTPTPPRFLQISHPPLDYDRT
jgi:hypothetical protein